MAKIGTALVVCALVASMVVAAESILTCGQVQNYLNPCIGYLKGKVGVYSRACCNGVGALNNAAKTTPDRQAVCNCLKRAATSIRSINLARARDLPGKCGVRVPYAISLSTDCRTIRRS